MQLDQALKVVIELAEGNVLTTDQTNNDEVLIAEKAKQEKAIDIVKALVPSCNG